MEVSKAEARRAVQEDRVPTFTMTRAQERIMVAQEIIGGQVRFLFLDDPEDLPYQRRMSIRSWLGYKI